jgi:hypothetical protein
MVSFDSDSGPFTDVQPFLLFVLTVLIDFCLLLIVWFCIVQDSVEPLLGECLHLGLSGTGKWLELVFTNAMCMAA